MVSSCLMLGCTSSTSTKGLSFHRFPKDPKLKSLWVAATRRHKWEPTKWSRICGAHFSPNNYKNNKLLAGSVPKRGIEVTHKASPHQGDKLLAGSVPNPKRGIEVTHKASPLQGSLSLMLCNSDLKISATLGPFNLIGRNQFWLLLS